MKNLGISLSLLSPFPAKLVKFLSTMIVAFSALATILGSAGWSQTVKDVYSFTGSNSAYPAWVTLVQGRDGRLYGTTEGYNFIGTIFSVSPTLLFTELFDLNWTDGGLPYAGVLMASNGSFYGTTSSGGNSDNGVFFEITRNGAYTVLHNFGGGSDGTRPVAAPVEASDGNLYGTTEGNPSLTNSPSTVYKYTRAGVFSTIYQFIGAVGQTVRDPLIQAMDGNLYGAASGNDCGTIFKMSTTGIILQYYSFTSSTGCIPVGPLLQAADGNFYGTTEGGGVYGMGTVFKMTPDFVVSTLHSFQGVGIDGMAPDAGLVQGTDGNLYGTASDGVGGNYGTLFQISTGGTFSLLYTFSPTTGDFPLGGLTQHTNGKFYGTLLTDGPGGHGQIYSLDMGLGPFITFVRANGKVGQIVEILGQKFTGTTGVTFSGVPATTFRVGSATYLTAVVPSGATTGPVSVTTPSGTLTSNRNFQVIP